MSNARGAETFPVIKSLAYLKETFYFRYPQRDLLLKSMSQAPELKEDKELNNYFSQAISFVDNLLKENPNDIKLIETRLFTYCQKSYLSNDECDTLLKEIDDAEKIRSLPRTVYHYLRAKLFIFKRNFEEAAKHFFKGMEEDCINEISYLCGKSGVLRQKTDEETLLQEQILAFICAAKSASPTSLPTREVIQQGDARFNNKQYSEAILLYTEALHSYGLCWTLKFDISTLKKLAESYRRREETTQDAAKREAYSNASSSYYLFAEWIYYVDGECRLAPDHLNSAINCGFKARDSYLKDKMKLDQAVYTHERQISYLNQLLDLRCKDQGIQNEFKSIKIQNKIFSDLLKAQSDKLRKAGDEAAANAYYIKAGYVLYSEDKSENLSHSGTTFHLKFYEQLTFKNEHGELPILLVAKNLANAVAKIDNGDDFEAIALLHNAFKYQLSLELYVEHLILCCFAHYRLSGDKASPIQILLMKKILKHMQFSDSFISSDKFSLMMKTFERQRNRLKKSISTLKIFQYAAYYQLVTNLIRERENISEIPRYLKIMTKLDSSDPDFWNLSSSSKILMAYSDPDNKQHILEEALNDINKALELNYSIAYLYFRTKLYMDLNKYESARKEFIAIFGLTIRENISCLNKVIPLYMELQDHFINQLVTVNSDHSPLKLFDVEKEREEWTDLASKTKHENVEKFLLTVDILFKRAGTANQLKIIDLEMEDYLLLNWMHSYIPSLELGKKIAARLPALLISNIKYTLSTSETKESRIAYDMLIRAIPSPKEFYLENQRESKLAPESKASIEKSIAKVKRFATLGKCEAAETELIAAFKKYYGCLSLPSGKASIEEGCFHLMFALVLEKAETLAKFNIRAAVNLYSLLCEINAPRLDLATKFQLDTLKNRINQLEMEEKLKEQPLPLASAAPKKKKKKIKTTQIPVEPAPTPVIIPVAPSKKELPKEKKLEKTDKKPLEVKATPSIKVTLPPIALDAINRLNKAGARATYAVGGLVCEVIKKINNDRTDIDLVFGYSATGDKQADDKANNVLVDEAFKDISEWISNKHGFYKIKLKGSNTTIDLMHSADLANKNLTLPEALKKDSENRDFTMNALYADSEGVVHDPVGRGLEDLDVNRLKSITESEKSFIHDPIRIFRAIYFYTKRECTLTDYMKNTIKNINPELFLDLLNNQPSKLNVWLRKLLIHGKGTKNFTELFELNVLSKFHPVLAKLVTEFPGDKVLILKQLSTMDANYQKTGRTPNFNAIFAFWMALIADRYKEQYKDISEVENDGILFKTNFKSLSDHFKDEPEKAVTMKNDLIKKASTFIRNVRDKSNGLNPKAQPYAPGMFAFPSSKVGGAEFKPYRPA